ncbi:hypothetical protein [Mesorhizobium sp.]|uniref:hypothetical protein n=1 Tax=Mesorhizobium sp. TaxID=1871066 RepID=UPI001216AE88|nr:hypothetical protein [Mesorhizobium sp.]TIR88407.1 MAG: hypothetical protein E5X13_31845 [Mesorhizobium sp.]
MSDDLSEDEIQRMAEKLLAGYQPASALSGLDPAEIRMGAAAAWAVEHRTAVNHGPGRTLQISAAGPPD